MAESALIVRQVISERWASEPGPNRTLANSGRHAVHRPASPGTPLQWGQASQSPDELVTKRTAAATLVAGKRRLAAVSIKLGSTAKPVRAAAEHACSLQDRCAAN